jgi:ABC-type sugar transport system substrate-binding protein
MFIHKGAALLVLGATLAACGASSNGSSSTSGSPAQTGGGAGVARAQTLVRQATARPSTIGLATAIGKPVPAGKKIAFISCGVQACEVQGNIIKQGAADLGWTASTINTDGSPEQLQNAFETALRQGADAVILNAVNRAAVAKQIAEAKRKGVAFVTCCSTAPPGDGILANVAGTGNSAKIGQSLAADIVADSHGKANTLYVNISAFEILKALGTQFESTYKQLCPGCGSATLDVPVTSIGKDAPDRIVSYLRSHPQVNYVVLSVSNALGAGLPAALSAAGLADKVKVVGQSGDTQTFQDLASNKMQSVVQFDYYAIDYLMLDALARHFAGAPEQPNATPPLWIVNAHNMPADATQGLFPVVTNYRSEFKQLWGK